MAQLNARLIAKASATSAEEPLPSDLEVAEIAVNTADGKLFTKHTDGSIVTISGNAPANVRAALGIGEYADNAAATAAGIAVGAMYYNTIYEDYRLRA